MHKGLKGLFWVVLVVAGLLAAGCYGMHQRHRDAHHPRCGDCPMHAKMMKKGSMQHGKHVAMNQQGERRDLVFLCDCGPQCKCDSIATTPGNCACGEPMRGYHVVKVEGDEALLCTCGPQCRCSIDPEDPTRCACGNQVKRVSLKGSGLYFCNCGGACTCNTVADGPGQCLCGMQLKKVN